MTVYDVYSLLPGQTTWVGKIKAKTRAEAHAEARKLSLPGPHDVQERLRGTFKSRRRPRAGTIGPNTGTLTNYFEIGQNSDSQDAIEYGEAVSRALRSQCYPSSLPVAPTAPR